MRAYLAILPALALVGCNPSAVERATDTGPKLSSKADLMDFADHPEKWKGKTITMEVLVYTSGKLKENEGKTVDCSCWTGSRFRFNLDVPVGLNAPNHDGNFYVTFVCENGRLDNGNVIKQAYRAD